MNIIARAALYLYDGSQAAPIFPDKVGKPGDEAAAYLSTVADKLMAGVTDALPEADKQDDANP